MCLARISTAIRAEAGRCIRRTRTSFGQCGLSLRSRGGAFRGGDCIVTGGIAADRQFRHAQRGVVVVNDEFKVFDFE
ncbi:hypothetical protein SAMN05216316_3117 [Nitrosovibrio sp. Nv6]|nr:hypothetical protein SAMN05216316_3117 [Nitrosovibrio sp. Nv6]